jgi:hypothetical protein
MTRLKTVHHVPEHLFTLTPVHTAPSWGGNLKALLHENAKALAVFPPPRWGRVRVGVDGRETLVAQSESNSVISRLKGRASPIGGESISSA